jgi:hypothetical protein
VAIESVVETDALAKPRQSIIHSSGEYATS